ncbi:MAG: hypothetical protein K1X88_14065 [Nannocystaceae bacterium]|nr:hypothetical protein [Nannocystaceae bacterium]
MSAPRHDDDAHSHDADADADAWLRDAWARAATDDVGDPGDADRDTLWHAVLGQRDRGRAAAAIAAAIEDPARLRELRLALALADAFALAPDAAAVDPARPRWTPLVAALAAAAALVLVLGIRPRPSDDDAALRGGDDPGALADSPTVLDREAFTLTWAPMPGAVRYALRVSTDEPRLVATRGDLTTTRADITPAELAALPAGTTLLWQVDGIAADGTRVRSRTATVTLR